MKLRKRPLLLSLILLLLAGGVLSLPPVHWRLIGWWRGEAFFKGLPTSYWRLEISTAIDPAKPKALSGPSTTSISRQLASWVGRKPTPDFSVFDLAHPAAVPVLCELARDPDPAIRWEAAWLLGQAAPPGSEVPAAVEALVDLLGDEAAGTRVNAAGSLEVIGPPHARIAVPVLLRSLAHRELEVRHQAAQALRAIDPAAAAGINAPN